MELTVSGPVVEGTFPTPSPGWITPVTFVLSVWAASLVMACCSGAACYKAWFMPRQSHIVVRESGNPIRTRRDSSRSTMTPDRTRNTMTAEERGQVWGQWRLQVRPQGWNQPQRNPEQCHQQGTQGEDPFHRQKLQEQDLGKITETLGQCQAQEEQG